MFKQICVLCCFLSGCSSLYTHPIKEPFFYLAPFKPIKLDLIKEEIYFCEDTFELDVKNGNERLECFFTKQTGIDLGDENTSMQDSIGNGGSISSIKSDINEKYHSKKPISSNEFKGNDKCDESQEPSDSLIAYLYSNSKTNLSGMPLIIYLHGNYGNVSRNAEHFYWLIDAGYPVLALEYQGFGESCLKASIEGIFNDIISLDEAFSHIRKTSQDNKDAISSEFDLDDTKLALSSVASVLNQYQKYIVFTQSLGGFAYLQSLGTKKLEFLEKNSCLLILDDTFIDLSRVSNEHFPVLGGVIGKLSTTVSNEEDLYSHINQLHNTQIYITFSINDELVSRENSIQMHKMITNSIIRYDAGNHLEYFTKKNSREELKSAIASYCNQR